MRFYRCQDRTHRQPYRKAYRQMQRQGEYRKACPRLCRILNYFKKLKDFYKNSQYIIYEDERSGIAHLRFVTDSDERACSVWINYPV